MQASQTPTLVPLAFAANGTKNTIPESSQIGITPGAASLNDGFPPLTFTPIAAGGVPPAGADFNGVLNLITQTIRWVNAGGQFKYNSTFAGDSNVGGYPAGAVLGKAGNNGLWMSTADNNATNPDTGGAGWIDPLAGRLLNVQVFSTPGTSTYTPTTGTTSVVVEVVGGGGAGGGAVATGASTCSVASGGNAGAYGKSRITSGFAGATVTVGAGGAGVSGGTGGSGGSSSFGALVSAPGGAGGAVPAALAPPVIAPNVNVNPASSGGNVVNAAGGVGAPGIATSTGAGASGAGGFSYLGAGGASIGMSASTAAAGGLANSPGSGGSGAASINAGAAAGGHGGSGAVIVWEYA